MLISVNIEFSVQPFNWQPQSSMTVTDHLQQEIEVSAAVNMARSSSYFSKYGYVILLLLW